MLTFSGVEEDISLRECPVVAQQAVEEDQAYAQEWNAVLKIRQPGATPKDLGIDVHQRANARVEVVADEALDLDLLPQVEESLQKV